MELYVHSSVCLHGVVPNKSTGTAFKMLQYSFIYSFLHSLHLILLASSLTLFMYSANGIFLPLYSASVFRQTMPRLITFFIIIFKVVFSLLNHKAYNALSIFIILPKSLLRTYIHTCIHACMHTYIHTYIHACIHTCIHTCMHTYIHIHTHTHTYLHIHAYLYTRARAHAHTHTNAAIKLV